MALPASFGTITVTGTYIDFLGNPATGTVTFSPPANTFLKVTDVDVMVVPKSIEVTLDVSGAFSVTLPLTDDPQVVPAFTYSVAESVTGLRRSYSVEIPTALLPGPVDLSDLAPTGSVTVGTTALTKTVADALYAPIDAAGAVASVNGETGAVTLAAADVGAVPTTRTVAGKALSGDVTLVKADVGLSNVDNTADSTKPVSTAQAAALALKAPLASPTFTGTVSGVTKTHVGLGNVDNTSDASKPVSTAQAAALALKAPLASPTFTGTVSGVTKTHVGLGNVDNTSDAAKPVSTATQTALDAKVGTSDPDLHFLGYGPTPPDPTGRPDGQVWFLTTA
jgi:hypothetical protein